MPYRSAREAAISVACPQLPSPGKSAARAETREVGARESNKLRCEEQPWKRRPTLQGMQQTGWAPGGMAGPGQTREAVAITQAVMVHIWPLRHPLRRRKSVPLLSSHAQAKPIWCGDMTFLSRKLWC